MTHHVREALVSWLRRLATRLEGPRLSGAGHRDLVHAISKAFGMPSHLRSFTIRWEVGHAITVTTESFPWKNGLELEPIVARTQHFQLTETARHDRPVASMHLQPDP